MNIRYFTTAACALALAVTPLAALAQQAPQTQEAGTAPGSVGSNSNAASNAQQQQSLVNGGSSANNGGVTVGAQTATSKSDSDANSLSVSGSTSTGGNSTADSHATGGTSSAVTGPSSATSGAANSANSQTTIFNSNAPNSVRTVPSTYAPALTTTLTETCMGSTSAGGSWLGGGISLGSTWRDPACVRRLNARELAQTLGDREAARAVMCGDADVADAYERLGRPCPKSPNYKSADAAQYVPQLPQPPAPPPPAPPVIVNVPAPAPAVTQMAPVANPPEPRIIYRDRPHRAARPKNIPACTVDPHACPAHDD